MFTQDPRRLARRAAALAPRAAARGLGGPLRASSARATTSQYVFPFENRGVEVGVTLHHPHGQIYAYPFVPPIAGARARAAARASTTRTAAACSRTMIDDEIARRRAHALRRAARGRVRAGVRALPVRSLGRAARAGRVARATSTRDERARPRARAEDGAAQVRRPVAAAVPVHHGVPPGADRRRSRIRKRTCTSSSIRRTACRAG